MVSILFLPSLDEKPESLFQDIRLKKNIGLKSKRPINENNMSKNLVKMRKMIVM
jgi:hypothetical protein